jgi:tRNA 2-thiouridine synthesizing protein A
VNEPNAKVDARGLQCPLPVFHARDALFDMAPGELLEVLADDPQAPTDFEKWCPKNGQRLIAIETRGRYFRILIKKGQEM